MTSGQSARRYQRVRLPTELLVAWRIGSQKYVSRAETLGLGGLFVRTEQAPAVGTSLQLLFNAVRVRAIVRNLEPGRGMGLAIVSMEPEHRARLDKWLKRLAAEAEPATPRG